MLKRSQLLPLFLLILTASCSEKPSAKEPQKAESAGEIVNKYTNTLTTAQDKARKAAEVSNARAEEDDKALRETKQ